MNGQRYDIPLGISVPNVNLDVSKNAIPISVSESIITVAGEAYEGEYTFTPTQEAQTIEIKNKVALENITIEPIPQNYGLITWNGAWFCTNEF